MDLRVQRVSVTEIETPLLVVNLFEGVTQPGGATGAVDTALGGQISQLIADGEITGEPATVTVIHNGVPDVTVAAIEVGPGPTVGCAARLEDQKRLDLLLAAVVVLPDVRVVVVGDGSRRGLLAQQAEALGISDRVDFVGWVDDARPYIAGFDAFVLPSRDESFPLTIVEAMLAGTPVVATDVGSVSEAVIDGETGLLVPAGDVAALSDAIGRVVSEPRLGERLAARARALAEERYTAAAMAEAYDRLWRDILGRSAR